MRYHAPWMHQHQCIRRLPDQRTELDNIVYSSRMIYRVDRPDGQRKAHIFVMENL